MTTDVSVTEAASPATVAAERDHGKPAADTIKADLPGAEKILADLKSVGIDLDAITATLLVEGVDLFAAAADQLYGAIAAKCDDIGGFTGSHKAD